MQKIDLISIGKLNASYFAAGVAEYQKRLGAFCEFRIIELPEETISEKNGWGPSASSVSSSCRRRPSARKMPARR